MELSYVKNFNCILLWVTLLAIIIATATSLTTDHEGEDNLNPNLNEEDETEFDTSNIPSLYSLRLNPKYFATLQHLMNKRIKGSEFLETVNIKQTYQKIARFKNKETKTMRYYLKEVKKESDIYGSQKTKRYSEFLGGPGKRLSEFLGGPGKRRMGAVTPSYFLAKKLSEILNSSFQRPVRFSNGLFDFYNPKGSEFLGGPGK